MTNKYIVLRITEDDDNYMVITTADGPWDSLERAKLEMRMSALLEQKMWNGEDDINDYFNEDQTSWGPVQKDPRRTRYVIAQLDPGLRVRVLA